MITEEEALAVPHTDEGAVHLWGSKRVAEYDWRDRLIPVAHNLCPYCGSYIEHYDIHIMAGGWTWHKYLCGTATAIGDGWRTDIPCASVLLGATAQTADCRAIAFAKVYEEDDVI